MTRTTTDNPAIAEAWRSAGFHVHRLDAQRWIKGLRVDADQLARAAIIAICSELAK